jgi:hypothetical protein
VFVVCNRTTTIVIKQFANNTKCNIFLNKAIFIQKALKGFGDFKIGGQIIHTVKYAGDLVLLAKEEKALQDMIDKRIEIGGRYGMKMNVEKTKVM